MRLSDLLQIQTRVLNVSGGCHNCPRARKNFVPAHLPQSNVIVVGETPGDFEVEQQLGLAGNTGKLLRGLLRDAGLTQYAITHTVHCQPPRTESGQDPPTPKEISCCLNQYTQKEIEPYPIVLLVGNYATSAFFPEMRLEHLRGNIAYHPDFPGKRFFSIKHPAYIVRHSYERAEWEAHIARFGRIVAAPNVPDFNVIQGTADFVERLRAVLAAANCVSLDLETTDLASWDPKQRIRSAAVTADGKDVFFAHEGEVHFPAMLTELGTYLKQPRKQVVGMHVGFDLGWLERELDFKVQCEFIHDVGVLFYQARQYQRMSMKEIASRDLDGYRYLVYQPHLERDMQLLALYNGEDVVRALQLYRKGITMLRPTTRDLFLRVGGPSDLALQRITNHGVYLRQDHLQTVKRNLEGERAAAVIKWQELDPQFNPHQHMSGDGLIDYLFRLRGLPVLKRTEKAQKPATDESTLRELMQQGYGVGPITQLLEIKSLEKQLGTYVEPYQKMVSADGRIHPNYNNTVTDTGRTSSDKPNFQNVPRKPYIRDLFGVPAGYTLLQSDFSQIELRIAMCLARDPNGIAAYLRGEDLHTETARRVAGLGEPTKEQRTHAKAINFALIYGGTAFTIQSYARDTYGIEFNNRQAQDYCDLFFNSYPALKRWHEQCNAELIANKGWAEHAVGHVFFYKDWDNKVDSVRDHTFRSHINSKGQGPAGYMAIYTLILAQRAFLAKGIDATTIGTVHDSILTEVRQGQEQAAIDTLNECVSRVKEWVASWFVVPLVMDHEVGPAWGSLNKYKQAA